MLMKVQMADSEEQATQSRHLAGLSSAVHSRKDKIQGPLSWPQSSCPELSFKLINFSTR